MLSQVPETTEVAAPKFTMNERQRYWFLVGVFALVAFAISCGVYVLVTPRIRTDFQSHAHDARMALATFRWPPHFLYFALVAIASLATSGSEDAFVQVSTVVIAGAITLKFLISTRIAAKELPSASASLSWAMVVGLFFLLFAHSMPRTPLYYSAAGEPWPSEFSAYCFYAGRATSTLWHNSTSVFCMPFVLLLFYETSLLLAKTPVMRPVRLVFFVGMVIIAKPSFLLAMAPILPVLAFVQHRFSRPFWVAVGTVAVATLLLMLQRRWLSHHNPGYTVSINFLRVWGPFAPVFPLDLIGSFAYPLIFAILFPRAALADRLYTYAAAMSVVAVAIGATACESYPFTDNGNFMWQVHICCYLWFLATFIAQMRVLSASGRGLGWRDVLVFSCLGLHVVNGVAYLIRSLVICTFM